MTTEDDKASNLSDPDIWRMDTEKLKVKPFPGRETEYRVILDKKAYDEIHAHGQSDLDVEVCGVLMGQIYRDEIGPYLLITDAIRGRQARQKAGQVTFTHSTWEYIHKETDKQRYADKRIVGWYHMHPGLGVFLSEVDLFAHRSFFNAAWQVAIVIDQKVKKTGIFFWQHGQIVRLKRYWIGDEPCWDISEHITTSTSSRQANEKRKHVFYHSGSKSNNKDAYQSDSLLLRLLTAGVLIILACTLAYQTTVIQREQRRLKSQVETLVEQISNRRYENARLLAGLLRNVQQKRFSQDAEHGALTEVIEKILMFDPVGGGIRKQYLHGLNANSESNIKIEN